VLIFNYCKNIDRDFILQMVSVASATNSFRGLKVLGLSGCLVSVETVNSILQLSIPSLERVLVHDVKLSYDEVSDNYTANSQSLLPSDKYFIISNKHEKKARPYEYSNTKRAKISLK